MFMKRGSEILAIAIGLLFFCQSIFAQTGNYSGTWVLNFEKSKLEHKPSGLTRTVFIIKQEGDQFRLTRYHIFGDHKKKISFEMMADGKTRRVKLLFKGKLEKKENSLLATLWRKNFLNVVNYKFGNSQNELIADEVMKSKPNSHHNIWVFDREISG
jgi:hypothetical protein